MTDTPQAKEAVEAIMAVMQRNRYARLKAMVGSGPPKRFDDEEHGGPTREDEAREIIAALAVADYAPRSVTIEECAKVAEDDRAQTCPYGNDKPGDATWDHTDDDVCPVCKFTGHESWRGCVSDPSKRIATAIRSLAKGKPHE